MPSFFAIILLNSQTYCFFWSLHICLNNNNKRFYKLRPNFESLFPLHNINIHKYKVLCAMFYEQWTTEQCEVRLFVSFPAALWQRLFAWEIIQIDNNNKHFLSYLITTLPNMYCILYCFILLTDIVRCFKRKLLLALITALAEEKFKLSTSTHWRQKIGCDHTKTIWFLSFGPIFCHQQRDVVGLVE